MSGTPENLIPFSEGSTGLVLAVSRALDWHEPGWPKSVEDVPHHFATREVTAIAGSEEVGTLGAPTLWQGVRQAAHGLLTGAALMDGCAALELRYVVEPNSGSPSRIRMFVTAKSYHWTPEFAEAAVEAACAVLPQGFAWELPEADPRFGHQAAGLPIWELRRQEEVTIPQWDYVPAEFFYTINDDPGDGSGWPLLWSLLAKVSQPATISLLFSQTDLHWDERNALAGITSDLALVAEQRQGYDVIGNSTYYPADTNAQVALQSWLRRIDRLQRPLLLVLW